MNKSVLNELNDSEKVMLKERDRNVNKKVAERVYEAHTNPTKIYLYQLDPPKAKTNPFGRDSEESEEYDLSELDEYL